MTEDIKKIYEAAIDAVDPEKAVSSKLVRVDNYLTVKTDSGDKKYCLDDYERIIVVGAGKATAPMASAVEKILHGFISKGIISVKYDHTLPLSNIEIMEAAHPVPDKAGETAAEKIYSLLESCGSKDLVISLISGGGSALLPLPAEGITLEEKQNTTNYLLKSGASIHEMNTVRKQLSRSKGGGLAKAVFPATVINLMISDVVGDSMDVIASGPFVENSTNAMDALEIISKYSLENKLPDNVLSILRMKAKESSEDESKSFLNVENIICSSNIISLKAAAEVSSELGYNSLVLSSGIEGDTEAVADFHEDILLECINSGLPVSLPACILSGGEATVRVTGNGLGGRNMEFAMQFIEKLQFLSNVEVVSIGTDGTDGPTDAAGAWVDSNSFQKCIDNNLKLETYKQNNDSYNLFKQIDALIITGPTNTNVMDVRIILIKKLKK